MKLTEKTHESIEFNDQFKEALLAAEDSSQNLFITGKAGTGKSTFLEFFRDNTQKNIVVLAPTGVAALNVGGQTIHSFFRFRTDITADAVSNIRLRKSQIKLYEALETVVIDEISMVRADLLDCIDVFLQIYGPKKGVSFGGVQMICVGDLYQLPPVVTFQDRELFKTIYPSPYFFDARSFSALNLKYIEFGKIYRQNDDRYIALLGNIRNNSMSVQDLNLLNGRCRPGFVSPADDVTVYLTTTNDKAHKINQQRLESLEGELYCYEGEINGEFDAKSLPTLMELDLKIGSQVMLLNNDPSGRWINGSIGKIIGIISEAETVTVELTNGKCVDVSPYNWEMNRFFYNEETDQIDSEVVGSFKQYPIRLAWAVTIHKSQGKTFDNVIVDFGSGTFSHGQAYVALSRCTTLEGIILKRPMYKRDILLDDRVVRFMKEKFYNIKNEAASL